MFYTKQADTYVIRFEDGEAVPERFIEFLVARSIGGVSCSGIGAVRRARIAYFNVSKREYEDIELDEQLEVLTLAGNVALHDGQPLIHAHVTLGRRDGSVLGGHLRAGIVRPTLEVVLRVISAPLERAVEPEYGLPSLRLENRF
jgi:predicted DNA-binding protein with PD1-like motif